MEQLQNEFISNQSSLCENVRYFCLMTYACLKDIIIVLNNHMKQIEAAFVNLHDKDINDNDEETLHHYHIVLWLKYPRRTQIVRNWFKHCMDNNNKYANTLVQHCFDCEAAYNYLTHKDNLDKYQYSEDDIIIFGNHTAEEFKRQKTQYKIKNDAVRKREESYDRAGSIVDELVAGTPFRLLIAVYGRDFIINCRHYCTAAALCCMEKYDMTNAMRLARYAGNAALLNELSALDCTKILNPVDDDEIMQSDFDNDYVEDCIFAESLGFSIYQNN